MNIGSCRFARLGLILCIAVLNGCTATPLVDVSFDVADHGLSGEILQDADPLFKSALHQVRQMDADGTNELRLMNAFGEYQMRENRFRDAAKTFKAAHDLVRSKSAIGPSEAARASDGLAAALAATGDFARARGYARESVDLYDAVYGKDSRSLGRALGLLGDIEFRMGHLKEAEAAYSRSVHVLCDCDGSSPGMEAGCAMRALGRCLLAQNRDSDADPWMRQSFEILRSAHAKRPKFRPL